MVTIRPALCAQRAFGASRTLDHLTTLPSPRPRSRAALGASTGTKTRCLRPYRPSPIIFQSAMGFVRWEQLSRSQILPLLSTHQKHGFWVVVVVGGRGIWWVVGMSVVNPSTRRPGAYVRPHQYASLSHNTRDFSALMVKNYAIWPWRTTHSPHQSDPCSRQNRQVSTHLSA